MAVASVKFLGDKIRPSPLAANRKILYPESMPALEDDNDLEVVPMELALDRATIAWLARLMHVTGTHPSEIVASMLRDIRADDEQAHQPITQH